jgi:AraC-like DNA-binding protein
MIKKLCIDTISEFHQIAGIPKPSHPGISVVKLEDIKWRPTEQKTSIIRDFYIIAWKSDINTGIRYGQQDINGEAGFMHFMAPKQVLTIELTTKNVTNKGWLLLIHCDFIRDTSLTKKMREHEYFRYDFNQVLPLNPEQESIINSVFRQIEKEQHQLKGNNTNDIILAQIDLLLAYAGRYYRLRQTVSAEKQQHSILAQLERLIDDYLQKPGLVSKGIPTVNFLSDKLHISPNYLTRLIQSLTGQSTQQFLHDKVINMAKEKVSTTSLSISEIAYELGFKTPQSFSRLFKAKTNQTPKEFRKSFF